MIDFPTFKGYAVCEELELVFPFVSDYGDRKSVSRNVHRCVAEHLNISQDYFICRIVELHTVGASGYVDEDMESFALDQVETCDGVTQGYRIMPCVEVSRIIDHVQDVIRDCARLAKVSKDAVMTIFNAWQCVEQEMDDAEAARLFEIWFSDKFICGVGR